MNRISRFALPIAFVAALTLGACSGEADIDINADSTAADTTVIVAPVDTVVPPVDTTASINIDSAANGAVNESVETLVEAQLMVTPGFQDVKVESAGDGAITLTGTVPTEAEKANAEAEAKKIVGVKSVINNITIK